MIYLLDVNVAIAAVWRDHDQHAIVDAWLSGKSVAVCPLTELGFLRISSHPKAFNVTMSDARKALQQFENELDVKMVPANLSALDSIAVKSEHVTDQYLGDLAACHGMKLATLDKGVKHPSAVLIA